MNPKISIIIPIYKAEEFLPQCLESILLQTFEYWECILVDDGSPDNCGFICDEYAIKDSRFRVVHKNNGGVSSARNAAIKEAKGEWLYFVDSDDTLYPRALSVLDSLIENNVDAVMAGYTVLPEYIDSISIRPIPFIRKKISVYDALVEMYCPSDFPYQGYLWCKLFKRSIIEDNNIRFNESIYFNEDRLFIVEYLSKCNNYIAYTTEPVYGYVNRTTGAMSSLKKKYNPKFVTDFDAYLMMYNVIRTYTNDKRLCTLAVDGILDSFRMNIIMMEEFNEYNDTNYKHMLHKLRDSVGVMTFVMNSCRSFVGNMLRLFLPTMAIKIKNK